MFTRNLLTLAVICSTLIGLRAQTPTEFFGLARTYDPTQAVYLATVDPVTGVVTNISTSSLSEMINLTGAALNPYNELFHYVAATTMVNVDLNTGNVVDSAFMFDPLGDSYFDNFRFNNSDSALYGLARAIAYDTVTMTYTNEMFLATVSTATGEITRISPTSIGEGFALAGSAIDPHLMVFYYSTGTELVGLDMYTGGVYSIAPITLDADDRYFDNFTYSCADTSLYGLIRTNYFTTYYDSLIMTEIEILDSTAIHLGRIDPSTGVVTQVSPVSIGQGGYTLNAGSTIDPDLMVFYYNNGIELVGVSLITGLVVSQQELTNTDGQMFELMRIRTNCIDATPMRLDPLLSVQETAPDDDFRVFPNPVMQTLFISATEQIRYAALMDITGRIILEVQPDAQTAAFDMENMENGVYLLRCLTAQGEYIRQVVKTR